MNAKTRLSAKGQVVIPKDVRDHLGLKAGQELDVIEVSGGVLLRVKAARTTLSFDEATARIRKAIVYRGPPLPVEALSWQPLDDDDDY